MQGQKAKSWEEKEADVHLATSSNLANALAIGVPYGRQNAANECLKRLSVAQELTRWPYDRWVVSILNVIM